MSVRGYSAFGSGIVLLGSSFACSEVTPMLLVSARLTGAGRPDGAPW